MICPFCGETTDTRTGACEKCRAPLDPTLSAPYEVDKERYCADPCTLPTWVKAWDEPTVNYGLAKGVMRPKFYERDREIADLEMHMMVSELEHHANWGV